MLKNLRSRYPTSYLISELATIHNGQYIVRALVQVNGENISSGLAAAETVELAEDLARKRAIENLELDSNTSITRTTSPPPTAISSVSAIPRAGAQREPASQKLTEIAPTREFVKTQSKTKKEPPPRPPEEPSPIASSITLNPVTIPPESESFDSDDWLKSTSQNKSDLEPEQFGGSGELRDSSSEMGSDRLPSGGESINQLSSETRDSPSQPQEVIAVNEPLDVSNSTAKIDILLSNLNWSKDQERDFLEQTYGQKMRSLLDEEKLLDFQKYLEVLAKVTAKIKALGWKPKQEKDYLKNHQGGRSLQELDAYELQECLEYLEVFESITQKIQELGWTNEQGKDYLQQTYGEPGRTRLSPDQLRDFFKYLESLPIN